MKKLVIKVISIIMMICTSVCIFGCKDKNNNKITETRYSEEEICLPDVNNVYDLKYINSRIILLGNDSNNTLVEQHYYSGNRWDKESINIHYEGKISDEDSATMAFAQDKSIEKYSPIDVAVSDEKNIAYLDYGKEEAKGKEFKDYNINHNIYTNDHKTIPLDISKELLDSVYNISYLDSKDVFAISKEKIYQYDGQTGKLKFEYSFEKGDIISQCCIYNNLYVVTSEGVQKYDITTGKKVEDIDSLKEYIEKGTKIFKGIGINIVIRNSKGLFTFATNNGEIKKVMDGKSTSIGDNSLNVENIIEYSGSNSKNEYLVLYRDVNNKFKLYKYKYSEELSNKELTEVKVYSLHESAGITDMMRKYQKDNEDIKINYEFGISVYGGITENDALKKLNTEIMAGKGPDILFLDGMSYDYYQKKGILENLDDIVEKNKDQLFSSVTDSFYQGNKIYMIPLKIKLPMLMGKDTVVKEANNLEDLSSSIESNLKNQDIDIMKIYNPEDIINLMYSSSSNDFVNGKDVNKESIKIFLESTKKIYDISKDKINKEEYKRYNDANGEYIQKYGDKYGFSRNMYLNKLLGPNHFVKNDITNLGIGYVCSLEQVSEVTSAVNNRDDIAYKYFTGDGQNLFLPVNIVSVNSKSKNKKLSKEMVSKLLSEEYFDSNKDSIFSINKNVLDTIYNSNKDNEHLGNFGVGNDQEGDTLCKKEWLDEKNYDYLLDTMNNLEKSVNTNTTILYPIVDFGKQYMLEEISLEEAVEGIANDVELKLGE